MEQLSDIQIEGLVEAGAQLEALPAWDLAREELKRRMDGVVTRSLLGKLDTYEDYLEARAEYRALHTMLELPASMKSMGAQQ